MGGATHRENRYSWLGIVILIICLALLGYQTNRTDHLQLIGLLFIAFAANWYLFKTSFPLKYLVLLGVTLRVSLLFMEPNLSEDIYRYIWDGQLLLNGKDPFAILPSEYAAAGNWPAGLSSELYDKLNSKDYFTIYPPLAQYIFLIVAWLGQSSVFAKIIIFRALVIVAEFGSLLLLFKLTKRYTGNSRSIVLYALNPVVILELTGNLHLEAFILPFLLLTILFLSNLKVAAVSHGFAVAVKLVPFIFLPLMIFRQHWKRSAVYLLVTFVTIGLIFYPIITPGLIYGMQSSIELYFQTFEFNASYYFILREIGYWRKGYNMIAEIGPALAFLSFLSIMIYSWLARNDEKDRLPMHMGFIWTIYLGLSTTVHPWYILPMVGLLSLTNYRYAYVWSFTIMWSYVGYTATGYSPPWILIIAEYLVVYAWMIYEITRNDKIYNNNRIDIGTRSGVYV